MADAIPYSRQFAAANNLYSNVEDMAKLMQANLNLGELDGTRILPARNLRRHVGGTLRDAFWRLYSRPTLSHGYLRRDRYGLGRDVRWGATPSYHSYGGERGFQSDMMLCPDMGVGVVAMGNGVAGGAFYSPEAATDVLGMVIDQ